MAILRQETALVHFVFIYYKAVSPTYKSKRLSREEFLKFRAMSRSEQSSYAITICGLDFMSGKIKHVDWMQSSMGVPI
ncbi:MAG: hypothetical protein NC453_15465 [Muribaculum sp.]|nr:hypothetical protein [Muribaculum sp.]